MIAEVYSKITSKIFQMVIEDIPLHNFERCFDIGQLVSTIGSLSRL